jgi:hypothetical protein
VGFVRPAKRLHRLICWLSSIGIANEWSSERNGSEEAVDEESEMDVEEALSLAPRILSVDNYVMHACTSVIWPRRGLLGV